MAEVETLPPVEISWKLASTTQPLSAAGADWLIRIGRGAALCI
jgi:hypothetical protein